MARSGATDPSTRQRVTVARRYRVLSVEAARTIAERELGAWGLPTSPSYGLPEVDDRYHVWRVPLLAPSSGTHVGEIVIDARTSVVHATKSSDPSVVHERLDRDAGLNPPPRVSGPRPPIIRSPMGNTIIRGDSRETLAEIPAGSVDLAFTSPPYYNARPDYKDYVSYNDYLLTVRGVVRQCHRVLAEGRFFVMNVSAVLVRRASRSEASTRIAVPFDMHRIFTEEGFEFIDDIIWLKPEGAGWATGRGRRFAADRNPLQYKAVPVTEYVLVYRKATDRLIDWNIRNHHDPDAVRRSKIGDGYDRTNVWEITPARSKDHPAVFPLQLAERVIRYYSFDGDVILDPFAGIGTTGEAAARLGRRFVLAESDPSYVEVMRRVVVDWPGVAGTGITCINCDPIDTSARRV